MPRPLLKLFVSPSYVVVVQALINVLNQPANMGYIPYATVYSSYVHYVIIRVINQGNDTREGYTRATILELESSNAETLEK